MNDEQLADDSLAGRTQACSLREQARAGGLRFEAYLGPRLADWLLDEIERGEFASPSQAVSVILDIFRELEPHHDLRNELLRRAVQLGLDSGPGISLEQLTENMERRRAEPRPEPARWQKIAS